MTGRSDSLPGGDVRVGVRRGENQNVFDDARIPAFAFRFKLGDRGAF